MGFYVEDDYDDELTLEQERELEEEREELLRDQYEFYDEWRYGEAWEEGVSLEDYDLSRRIEKYGLELGFTDETDY